jgi:hypothetical protein
LAAIVLQSKGEKRTEGASCTGRIGRIQRRHRILDCFKQRGNVGLAAVALALGQAVSVQAIDPQELLAPIVGPVLILPHVSLSESYDDNVFLMSDEQGKIDDLVTTLSPGIGLQFGENILDSNYIGLDYTLSQNWYAENNELNSDNHALTFGINYLKEGKFTFTGGDMISLDNSLLKGREKSYFTGLDEGTPETRGIVLERKSFNDQYRFEYTISPKTSVYAATYYNAYDYSEEPHYYYQDVFGTRIPYSLFDVANWNNTVGFGWQAFAKIKLYGSFFYGTTMIETNLERMGERPDSDFFGGHISAVGDFSEKLKGKVQVGYQTRQFDRLSNGSGGRSHSLPIFEAEVDYDFTEKRMASLIYRHGGSVSVQSPDSAVTTDYVILQVTQQIGTTGKFSANFGTTYELDTYETRDAREYQYLGMNAEVSYSFNQWLTSNLRYDFEMLDSNQGNIDYNANRVMVGLSVGY